MTDDHEDERSELEAFFADVDANADGAIQFAEFETLLRNLGSDVTHEECKIGFKELDANKDGQINFDEFIRFWGDH